MNQALKQGREKYLKQVRDGEIKMAERLNPIESARRDPKSRKKAIAGKCFDCTCYQRSEVTRCEHADCSLWPLRPWQRR